MQAQRAADKAGKDRNDFAALAQDRERQAHELGGELQALHAALRRSVCCAGPGPFLGPFLGPLPGPLLGALLGPRGSAQGCGACLGGSAPPSRVHSDHLHFPSSRVLQG